MITRILKNLPLIGRWFRRRDARPATIASYIDEDEWSMSHRRRKPARRIVLSMALAIALTGCFSPRPAPQRDQFPAHQMVDPETMEVPNVQTQ